MRYAFYATGVTVAAAFLATPVQAASYTDQYTFTQVNFTGNVISESETLSAFNASLGTLQSVVFEFDGSYQTQFTFDQFAGQTVDYETRGPVTVYFDGSFADFNSILTGTATFTGSTVTLPAAAIGTRTFTGLDLFRFTENSPVYLQFGYPQVRFGGTQVFPNGMPTVLSQLSTLRVTFNYDDGRGAVPEPAAWTMMIAGFGLVGAATRRGRGAARLT